MKFGPVPVADAEGAILAHSESLLKGRLRKGRVLGLSDIDALQAAGHQTVVVARLEQGDIHEDEAAARLARAILGEDPEKLGVRVGTAATGRVNLYSMIVGIAEIDPRKIDAINAVDPMITIATVPLWHQLGERGMLATIKIISYAVPEARLREAENLAPGALGMRAPVMTRARLIQTTVADDDGAKGHRAIQDRLARLGLTMEKTVVPHDVTSIAAAIEAAKEDLLLILTGSATSDLRDTAPEAVRAAGGTVAHYGMPVDPGNLLFLGAYANRPVIGLPGCARSPSLNGADWVMERVVCGLSVGREDIMKMGVGGLLKDIPTRPLPREKLDQR